MTDISFAVIDDSLEEMKDTVEYLNMHAKQYNVEFHSYNPENNTQLESALEEILSSNDSGIIIDHRLYDTSGITISGAEVCRLVKNTKPSLPTYILTKWTQDKAISNQYENIDLTISKKDLLRNPELHLRKMLQMSRRYFTTRENDLLRLNKLISESFDRPLTKDESAELEEIKLRQMIFSITRSHNRISEETEELNRINAKLDNTISLLKRLLEQ